MKSSKEKSKRETDKTKKTEKNLLYKLSLCTIYLIAITVLFVCSYNIFNEKKNIISWDEVTSSDEYSYIEVSKMSEKFAYYEESGKELHFVIETEDTGLWHTYIIAIDQSDYEKYKDIIDYTYERTEQVPKTKKVYGYPVIISDELKDLAINNIKNFLPVENEVVITKENFNDYLTNSYLDTTQSRKDDFNIVLCILLFLLAIMIILFIYTLFSKEPKKPNVDEILEDFLPKKKKHLN